MLTSVPSVPYLEALLLLRANGGEAWDALGVSRRLYVAEAQAQETLEGLHAAGIAVRTEDGRFRYEPTTPDARALLDAVAATYAANLVGVTELIHSRLDKRALQFADAFRWKKDDR